LEYVLNQVLRYLDKFLRRNRKMAAVSDFKLVDNGDDSLTVMGVDKGGNDSDLTGLVDVAWSSSDPTIVTVDATGVTSAMHAVGPISVPGTPVVITAVVTWKDGSVGPFTGTMPVDVIGGAAVGLKIVPGVPTTH
jgi:fructose 1,6-bisphosphatase